MFYWQMSQPYNSTGVWHMVDKHILEPVPQTDKSHDVDVRKWHDTKCYKDVQRQAPDSRWYASYPRYDRVLDCQCGIGNDKTSEIIGKFHIKDVRPEHIIATAQKARCGQGHAYKTGGLIETTKLGYDYTKRVGTTFERKYVVTAPLLHRGMSLPDGRICSYCFRKWLKERDA